MFDPTKPAANSPNSSAEMRGQLTSLNTDIQQRATQAQLTGEIGGTSANSNGVAILGMAVSATRRPRAKCRPLRTSSMN